MAKLITITLADEDGTVLDTFVSTGSAKSIRDGVYNYNEVWDSKEEYEEEQDLEVEDEEDFEEDDE